MRRLLLLVTTGCAASYTTSTADSSVGPERAAEDIPVFTGEQKPSCTRLVPADNISVRGSNEHCTEEEAVKALRQRAADLGYDGVYKIFCVPSGLVGHSTCSCDGRPYQCEDGKKP